MIENVDYVVIGGGHNGLVCGCYLARTGARVLVLEQHERLGGMTLSAPLIDEAPGHLVNPGAYENVYLRAGGVIEDLGLRAHGYDEVDSAGWAWLGPEGDTLWFRADVDATARGLARFDRRDAESYRELVAVGVKALELQAGYAAGLPSRPSPRFVATVMRSIVANRRLRAMLGALMTGTAADVIPSIFRSPQAQGAFASIATILGAPTGEGSAMAMLGTSSLHWRGAARPIGGMGGLVTALVRCLESHGGEARASWAVSRVESRGGRAADVHVAGGATIHAARGIVSCIPPQRVPDLVDDASLTPKLANRLRAAPANATGVATLTVNLALGAELAFPAHRLDDGDIRRPALFTGTFDGVMQACEDCARGDLASAPAWWLTIFNAMDPTQSPAGQDTVQLYGPAPVAAREGWASRQGEAVGRLIEQAAQFAPGISSHELGRFVETPADLTARTTTVNGCLYHVDHLATRLGPLRPALGVGGYRTPLPGFYVSGAGCHPSGGVSGLPGKLAAMVALEHAP